jgi:hypothetical protein
MPRLGRAKPRQALITRILPRQFAYLGNAALSLSAVSGSSLSDNAANRTCEVGELVLLFAVLDNTGTTDADHSEVTSVTDSGSNTYTKLGEWTNGEGVAADGITVSLWMSRLTTQVVISSGSFTANFSNAITHKCLCAEAFSVAAGTLSLAAPAERNATDASNGFGSVAFAGLSSKERLYFRALGKEAGSNTLLTPSTNFTVTNGTRSSAGGICIRGEFRINTSTGETSNPAMAVAGDTAGVFVALELTATAASFKAAWATQRARTIGTGAI